MVGSIVSVLSGLGWSYPNEELYSYSGGGEVIKGREWCCGRCLAFFISNPYEFRVRWGSIETNYRTTAHTTLLYCRAPYTLGTSTLYVHV